MVSLLRCTCCYTLIQCRLRVNSQFNTDDAFFCDADTSMRYITTFPLLIESDYPLAAAWKGFIIWLGWRHLACNSLLYFYRPFAAAWLGFIILHSDWVWDGNLTSCTMNGSWILSHSYKIEPATSDTREMGLVYICPPRWQDLDRFRCLV